ncbi:MAG: hypothetical protein V3U84_05100 [Thiotrichaceae bacterium]
MIKNSMLGEPEEVVQVLRKISYVGVPRYEAHHKLLIHGAPPSSAHPT